MDIKIPPSRLLAMILDLKKFNRLARFEIPFRNPLLLAIAAESIPLRCHAISDALHLCIAVSTIALLQQTIPLGIESISEADP